MRSNVLEGTEFYTAGVAFADPQVGLGITVDCGPSSPKPTSGPKRLEQVLEGRICTEYRGVSSLPRPSRRNLE